MSAGIWVIHTGPKSGGELLLLAVKVELVGAFVVVLTGGKVVDGLTARAGRVAASRMGRTLEASAEGSGICSRARRTVSSEVERVFGGKPDARLYLGFPSSSESCECRE